MKCTHCRIGHYHTTQMPYITFLDEQIMVVPNVLAYRCDMCGDVLFNEGFLDRLQYLLDQLRLQENRPETAEWLNRDQQTGHWQTGGRMS